MQDQSINFLKYILIAILVLNVHSICAVSSSNIMNDAKIYQESKQNLLSKELEYLKRNPLSRELRSFINRYKRKAKFPIKKRDDEKQIDKEHMFVVKDGDIIPLNNMDSTSSNEEVGVVTFTAEEDEKFTVIPLIVPITVEKERHATCDEDEITGFSTVAEAISTTTTTTTTMRTTTTPRGPPRVFTEEPTTKVTTPQNVTDEDSNVIPASVNPKLLNKVYADIKELITDQDIPKGEESSVCSVNGDWDSTAGGMQIRITLRNDTKRPGVMMVDREPPPEEGFFKDSNWTVSALVPFTKASILVLNAHTVKAKKKLVAVFIGECKICEQEEAISGHWLIQRQSKDCSDLQVSHKFLSDVLKKNNIRMLQQHHIQQATTAVTGSTVG